MGEMDHSFIPYPSWDRNFREIDEMKTNDKIIKSPTARTSQNVLLIERDYTISALRALTSLNVIHWQINRIYVSMAWIYTTFCVSVSRCTLVCASVPHHRTTIFQHSS